MMERIGIACALAALAACVGTDGRTDAGEVADAKGPRTPEEAATLFQAAEAHVRDREYAEARALYLRVAKNPGNCGDIALVAESCAQVARMDSVLGEAGRGTPWLERAAELAGPEHPAAFARLLLVQGVYAREEGRAADAVALFERCWTFSTEHGLHDRALDAAHHVAIAAEDPAQRERWAKRAIAAAEASGAEGWLAALWNNLGWDYVEQGREAEALEALRHAQNYHHRRGGHPTAALVSDYSVGFALRLNGRLTRARSMQEAVHEAALRAYERGDDALLEWVAQSRRELGELDAAEGDPASGADRIERAIAELREAGFARTEWGRGMLERYQARLAELRAAE